uniref:Dipeptidyl-peptidase 6b n=1 Tax=Gasterosteus aculeatus aculeatus TaxID=481459 RepID=A0AAQ4QNA3_GASAC
GEKVHVRGEDMIDDLGSSDGPPRNWKGIGIAVVVILAVMSLVILSVILLTPDESHLLLRSHLTMEDLERAEFKVHNPCAAWLNGKDPHFVPQLTPDSPSARVGLSQSHLTLQLVLSRAYVCVFVCSRNLLELNPPEKEKSVLQHASWGPQGSQLAYVFDGDIYYRPNVNNKDLRLTTTDLEHNVVNGLSDWTYEEEVLLTHVAHWWSADGARLAYLAINNSATPVMEIPHFLGGLYPSNVLFPYPKAGSSIPSVSLFVVNLYGPAHTLEMMPLDSLRVRYYSYISMVTWISSTRLAVRWLNRAQNQSVLCVCEATTGACSEVSGHHSFRTSSPQMDVPLFSSDGSVFYTILPAKQGARGEFHHIAGLSAQAAIPSVPARFLTSGSWDVISLSALDEKAGKMYVTVSVCVVDLDGVFQRRCISCNRIDGCRFFKAEFSPDQSYFILYCLGPGIPKVTVHSTKDPSRYVILEDNSPLSKALEDKRLPETLYLRSPVLQHLFPYSLILLVLSLRDGVPGSQSVTEEFSLDWPQVLSGTHNVALAWVDGRSGVGRGQKTTTVDPRKLGSVRVKDYLGVVELLMQLPYIDDRRIILYGKAFGGYLTLKMLTATDKVFQCTAAVAPITDFRLYSAAFSERYLGLPAKEEHAYSTASLLEEVNKLKDENFLILHGTADARVHFQHSAELLSRLVKVEANYTLQLYPDEGHVLREAHSIQHFQRTVVNYLQSCLKRSTFLPTVEDDEEEDD